MSDPGFRYLNLENRWPLINATARPGLVIRDDGALSLARTSAAMNPPPTAQALAAVATGGATPDCTIRPWRPCGGSRRQPSRVGAKRWP